MSKGRKSYSFGGKQWVLDSGCTDYMTGDKEMFHDFDAHATPKCNVTSGDNSKGKVVGLGKVATLKDTSIKNVMLV